MRKSAVRPRRRGIITALVAVALVGVMMIAAIAIDGGRVLDDRRLARAAADAAARGAAVEMLDMTTGANPDVTLGTIRATAFRLAADNSFENDGTNSVVTVNTPPASGSYAGQDGYIEVIIESRLQRGFSRLLGSDPISVIGRSVAGGTYTPSKGSVVVLNPTKKETLRLGGKTSRLLVDGDIAVNSKSNKPIKIDDQSQLQADNVHLAGSLKRGEFQRLQRGIHGRLNTQVPATENPFASLPVPTPGVSRKLDDFKSSANGKDRYDLLPGTYTEDWKFDDSDVVNLAPGLYYLDNKKLEIKEGATITGNGVTIYGAGSKEFKFNTSGGIHLSPPSSGPYAGILLFRDPAKKSKITFKKDATLDISGAIYGRLSEVRFQSVNADIGGGGDDVWEEDFDNSGPSDPPAGTATIGANIVCDKLKIEKNSTVTIHGAYLNIQRPFLALVE